MPSVQNMREANPSETTKAETFTKTELVHELSPSYPDEAVTVEARDLAALAMVEYVPRFSGLYAQAHDSYLVMPVY